MPESLKPRQKEKNELQNDFSATFVKLNNIIIIRANSNYFIFSLQLHLDTKLVVQCIYTFAFRAFGMLSKSRSRWTLQG